MKVYLTPVGELEVWEGGAFYLLPSQKYFKDCYIVHHEEDESYLSFLEPESVRRILLGDL